MLYLKEKAREVISSGLHRLKSLSGIKHPYLKGRTVETFIQSILEPFTPNEFGITSGKIIDHKGNESPELDVIVFWKSPLPSIIIDKEISLIPIESVLYIFEVKTNLRKRGFTDAISKFRLSYGMSSLELHGENWKKIQPNFYSVLFFRDEPKGKHKNILDVYKSYDNSRPPFCRTLLTPGAYAFWGIPPSKPNVTCWNLCYEFEDPNDYIVSFMTGYANTLVNALAERRRFPPVGYYKWDSPNPIGIID